MSEQSNRQTERHSLREWRELHGLSQAQLATAAGVSQQMLWRIEAEKSTPNVTLAVALADALGLSIYDIVWPETTRYGVGSKPSIAQAAHQQRMRDERETSGDPSAE